MYVCGACQAGRNPEFVSMLTSACKAAQNKVTPEFFGQVLLQVRCLCAPHQPSFGLPHPRGLNPINHHIIHSACCSLRSTVCRMA